MTIKYSHVGADSAESERLIDRLASMDFEAGPVEREAGTEVEQL